MKQPPKSKGKKRVVKGYALIKKYGHLSFRRENGYSPYIYQEKYEAEYMIKTWKRLGYEDYKIVPVTIHYNA